MRRTDLRRDLDAVQRAIVADAHLDALERLGEVEPGPRRDRRVDPQGGRWQTIAAMAKAKATRDERITIRVRAEFKKPLEAIAARDHRTLASWVELILAAVAPEPCARSQ